MANLRVEESRKLMSPNSDLSFEELEASQPKSSSARSSDSDFSFGMPKGNNSRPRSSWGFKTLSTRHLRLIVSVAIALVVAFFVYLILTPAHRRPVLWNISGSKKGNGFVPPVTVPTDGASAANSSATKEVWVKPTGFKIVGLLFCTSYA